MAKSESKFVFPISTQVAGLREQELGITKREYFASKAMQAIIGNMARPDDQTWGGTAGIVHHAYKIADEMLNHHP